MIPSKYPLLKEAEDRVSQFINGGNCQKTTHEGASILDKLVMLKMLRLDLPHVSTHPMEIDFLIRRELKKANG